MLWHVPVESQKAGGILQKQPERQIDLHGRPHMRPQSQKTDGTGQKTRQPLEKALYVLAVAGQGHSQGS